MNCPVCNKDIPQVRAEDFHLLLTKNLIDNHIHIHGDIESDKTIIKELLLEASDVTQVDLRETLLDKKELVFHNRQRIGDILMFTCGVRDFKLAFPDVRVNVISTAGHIWDNNPYVDRTLVPTSENTVKIGPGRLTNSSNRLDWHFANAYRVSIEDNLKIHIPQGESRPDIWLTEEEYNAPRVFQQPYWLIVLTGEKGWGCKMYPFEKWQEFVNQNKDLTFVQLGTREDNPPRLQGSNVIDFVGKTQEKETGIRDLFKLFLNAEGSIGLVSFHMHLSGALYKPAVIVAGAREPVHFTRYEGHRYLSTDGCLPCATKACWHCDITACKFQNNKVPECVDMISPEDLTSALKSYYKGGRLKVGTPAEKPVLKNIVKVGKVTIPVRIPEEVVRECGINNQVNTRGLVFGGGAITKEDWDFIYEFIKDNKVNSVLEFGAGLSTLLFNDVCKEVVTFETDERWIKKIKDLNSDCNIIPWDGKSLKNDWTALYPKRYALAFVDGPSGSMNREVSTRVAAELADVVIVHDANREGEKLWQEKYINGKFIGPTKGGKRCHLWLKRKDDKLLKNNGTSVPLEVQNIPTNVSRIKEVPKSIIPSPDGKNIKIVSTARGWGGCARSVTTIMKFLLLAGHRVEFIPFRNKVSSREYQDFLRMYPEIKVTEDYNSLKEKCDVLLMYADDYIWEFGKNKEVDEYFEGINADKKIMMLNYRRGPVGIVNWTKNWDKYMFLNSAQEKDLLKLLPNAKTKVLPPCTELEPFLKVNLNYNNNLRVVRHSSQGDVKFPQDFKQEVNRLLSVNSEHSEFHFLPGPSFLEAVPNRIIKYPRTDSPNTIAEFLSKGNLFWYSLPIGYMDMGPRVVLEAMASGLPILADNWGGVVDRVTPECGWLCNTKEEQAMIMQGVTFKELASKGRASRERAINEFIPERWIEEIVKC